MAFKKGIEAPTILFVNEFNVNLQDPASIAQALDRAQRLIEQAEAKHRTAVVNLEAALAREREATAELERWRALALTLRNAGEIMAVAAAAEEEIIEDADADPSSKMRALQVVTAINGPASIGDVAEHMQQFDRKTVAWALWKLAEESAIQRIGRGTYAPLGYVPGAPTTNYTKLSHAFPAPSRQHITAAAEAALRESES